MSPANLAHSAHAAGIPPSGARASDLRGLGLTFERLAVQKVGFGSVAWLRLGPVAAGLHTLARRPAGPIPPQTPGRDDARSLQIGETGQVPELQVENRGGFPLLLPAHLVLSGGWQTRAVERSVVVPGGGSARVPVKCVEAGRWAPRDEQTAHSFEVADRTGVRTRWSTARSMADQLTRHGRFAAEQSAVWQQVDEELTRSAVPSRTRSYEAYLHGVKRRLVAEAHKASVRPPSAANGVAIFPQGGGFWIEAYPTADALAEHADDLLSDLFDSFSSGALRAPSPDADWLLDALWSTPLLLLDRIAGTAGNSFAMSNGPERAVGAVLVVDGALAHLTLGAAPAKRDDGGVSGDRHSGSGDPDAGAAPAPDAGVLLGSAGHDGGAGPKPPAHDGGSAPKPPAHDGGAAPKPPAHDGGSAPKPPAHDGGSAPKPPAHDGGAGPKSPAPSGHPAGGASKSQPAAAQGSDGANERPRIDLETMQRIYARARDLQPEEPPARERVQGYRLVRVLDRNISWVDVRISGDGYAVLGSHDRCDLVLSSDAGIWLRHLAAICVRLDDDSVGLRLIDLKTDLPFFLDDDTPRWSVLARGPFAMRLGRHVVCGFPIGAATTENTVAQAAQVGPRPVPEAPRIRDLHETGVLDTGLSFGTSGAPVDAHSIAVVPGPNELSSFVASAPVSQIQDLLGPSASPNHVRVTLERGGMGASVELPAEAMEAGVLLGRALNCFDGGLRRIFCEAISRAHVLLVRDREDVFAFDLCSTNGTRVAGQRIRRHRLSDAGTTLELGKKVIFRWHRRE